MATPGFYKLDVDGSFFGNPGRTGLGGLVRTEDGNWVVLFSGYIGMSTNLHGELLALWHGLQVAWDMGLHQILCCSDSVVSLVNKGVPNSQIFLISFILSRPGCVNTGLSELSIPCGKVIHAQICWLRFVLLHLRDFAYGHPLLLGWICCCKLMPKVSNI